MAERIPPGRAGRLWLIERLGAARRGVDLLDQKRLLLRRESERFGLLAQQRRRALADAYANAQRWTLRAAMLGGSGQIDLAAGSVAGRASVNLSWRNTMGVVHPEEAACVLPAPSPAELAAGNAALRPAADGARTVLTLAADLAVAETAQRRVDAELQATQRRLRAIERHRIPAFEDALHALELQLDELEREDRVVTRWAQQRREAAR